MLLLALLFALQSAAPAPAEDEIIVTAVKKKCRVSIADRIIGDSEFKAKAKEWAAGKPVRVRVPAGSSYTCMAKIMFRLNEYGVTRATFVDGTEGQGVSSPPF